MPVSENLDDLNTAWQEHIGSNAAIRAWEELEITVQRGVRTGASAVVREGKDVKRAAGHCGGFAVAMCCLVAPLQIAASLCSFLASPATRGPTRGPRSTRAQTAPPPSGPDTPLAPAAWIGVRSACWVLPNAEETSAKSGLRQWLGRGRAAGSGVHPTDDETRGATAALLQIATKAPQLLVRRNATVMLRGVGGVDGRTPCTVVAVLSRQEFLLCARPLGARLEAIASASCAMKLLEAEQGAAAPAVPIVPPWLRRHAKASAKAHKADLRARPRRCLQGIRRRPATPSAHLRVSTPALQPTLLAKPSHTWAQPGLRSSLTHHGVGRPLAI